MWVGHEFQVEGVGVRACGRRDWMSGCKSHSQIYLRDLRGDVRVVTFCFDLIYHG